LGKNEDFFIALWIFRPKTMISRGVHQLISRLSLLLPPQCPDLAYFRAVVVATLRWAQLAFVLF